MKSTFKKFVAGFDAHIGWEIKRNQKIITHDPKVLNLHLRFVNDFKPDIYIAGGDIFNMSPISRHNNGQPRLLENLSLSEEYELADSLYFTPLDKYLKKYTKVYLPGNHEAWVEQFLDKNPTLQGMLEPEKVLNLTQRGWTVVDYGGIYKLGKLNVVHGDSVRSSAKYRAAKMLDSYKANILSGHVHTSQVHLATSMSDEQPHMSVIAPMLGAMKPSYLNGNPTNWCQGWCYGYVLPSGLFNIYTVIVSEGKAVVEGKLYA